MENGYRLGVSLGGPSWETHLLSTGLFTGILEANKNLEMIFLKNKAEPPLWVAHSGFSTGIGVVQPLTTPIPYVFRIDR